MAEELKVQETWSGEVSIRREVKVVGVPDLMIPGPLGGTLRVIPRRYRLHRVDILSRWKPGALGTLDHFVTLHVREVIGGLEFPREGKMYLDQLREVPSWLQGIVERGSVRCRCQYLGTAPGGEEPAEVVTEGCAIHLLDLLPPPPPGPGDPDRPF